MKPILIAAALLLAPSAAFAQVAAATLPNTFDRPAAGAPRPQAATPAPTAPVVAPPQTPANPKAEETLRALISSGQAGAMDYALMTDDLATKVRAQEAQVGPLLKSFGVVQAVDFVGSQNGADLFAVAFATAATQWVIGFDEAGKVAALLFRPAPTEAAPAPAAQ